MSQQCDGCRFYSSVIDQKDNGEGICRRNPPLPISVGTSGWATVYTPVQKSGWCGEWIMKRQELDIVAPFLPCDTEVN